MKALLTTRCGCTKELLTTYPPPPNIQIPLQKLVIHYYSPSTNENIQKTFEIRTFLLKNTSRLNPSSVAFYYEKEEL